MEVQYQNEGFHQYMILHSENIMIDGYEVNMLAQFRGTSLLPLRVYGQNGQVHLQYEISEMAAFDHMVDRQKVDSSFLRRILTSVWKCCDELEEHLLSVDSLILDPHMIYYHPGRQQWYYCYLPERQGSFHEDLVRLVEFCMKYTDYKDKEAFVFTYGLYRYLQGNSISRETVQKYIQNIQELPPESISSGSSYEVSKEIIPVQEQEAAPRSKRESALSWRVYLYIGIAALCIGVLILSGILYMVQGRQDWLLRIMLCSAIGAVISVYCALHFIRKDRSISKSDPEIQREVEDSDRMEVSKDMAAVSVARLSEECEKPEEPRWKETSVLNEAQGISVPEVRNIGGNLWELISMKRDIPNIPLHRLPGVIGRQKQNVDYVISDPGVSRRHAMIFESGDKLYVEDLGSTNGTYIDEERIRSGAPKELKEDAILRISAHLYQIRKRGTGSEVRSMNEDG